MALAKPLEQSGDSFLYVLLLAWTPDVEDQGFNVHEIAINTPVKWKDKVGNTTIIEYINSDMGLIAGREVYGWPKKMADIIQTKTTTGWMIVANMMRDQGSIPLTFELPDKGSIRRMCCALRHVNEGLCASRLRERMASKSPHPGLHQHRHPFPLCKKHP